ncbi:MAG: FliH/SctL family protein [Burkholderiales bacterium]
MSNRIIGAEELGEVRQVKMLELFHEGPAPAPGGGRLRGANREPPPDFKDGFRRGMEEGFRRGSAAAADQIQREHGARLQSIVDQFAAQAQALHAGMDQALATVRADLADQAVLLALEVARQVIRADLTLQPASLLPVVREAVASLVDERCSFVLHMNPQDVDLLGASLEPMLTARGARIQPDPAIGVGGCRVQAPGAEIDATLSTRWARVLAAIGRSDELPAPEVTA